MATIPVAVSATDPQETPASKYWDAAKKKFVITAQIRDDAGNPVGPPQTFAADTLDELLEKKDAAHLNAARRLYETRKAVKIGELLETDPAEPITSFDERPLTADERVKIAVALKDPQTGADAIKTLLESYLGAPLATVRATLRQVEIDRRVREGQEEVDAFKEARPEYFECGHNHDLIVKWLNKRKLALTKKNLEIAYGELGDEGLLTVRPPKPEIQALPAAPATVAAAETAPPLGQEIPAAATLAPPISGQPTEVRPRVSSSGLSSRDSSATPAVPGAKTQGITLQDVRKMTASQYGNALARGLVDRDGRQVITAREFRRQVDELLKK